MMRSGPIGVSVSLVLAASVALAPTAALAGGSHGRTAGSRVAAGGRPFMSHPSVPHHSGFHHSGPHHAFGRGFVQRPGFRPFIPFPLVASSVIVYATPAVYPSAIYTDPPVSYVPEPAGYGSPPGGTVSVAPAPPPMPTVVQFPTGRYELRGDGMTTPYTWVWIPNPPTAPPGTPPTDGPASESSAPARSSRLYRWTDEQGVVHVTDNREAVPQLQAEQTPPR
jgi:hypothetical protein